MTANRPTRILFVCMGNICRSPLAEGVFLHLARERGVADQFEVDSAGTGGWHAGERADPRMLATAGSYGVDLPSRARQVRKSDFDEFDLVLCMDEDNRENLLQGGCPPQKLTKLLSHDPKAKIDDVPDPYYGGDDGFQTVYRLVLASCEALLDKLLDER